MPEDKVIKWLDEQIRKSVDDGFTDFITGMQRGVYTGAPGGTRETIIYARNHEKEVILIKDGS